MKKIMGILLVFIFSFSVKAGGLGTCQKSDVDRYIKQEFKRNEIIRFCESVKENKGFIDFFRSVFIANKSYESTLKSLEEHNISSSGHYKIGEVSANFEFGKGFFIMNVRNARPYNNPDPVKLFEKYSFLASEFAKGHQVKLQINDFSSGKSSTSGEEWSRKCTAYNPGLHEIKVKKRQNYNLLIGYNLGLHYQCKKYNKIVEEGEEGGSFFINFVVSEN